MTERFRRCINKENGKLCTRTDRSMHRINTLNTTKYLLISSQDRPCSTATEEGKVARNEEMRGEISSGACEKIDSRRLGRASVRRSKGWRRPHSGTLGGADSGGRGE